MKILWTLGLIVIAAGTAVAFGGGAHAQTEIQIPVGNFWFCNSDFQGEECVTAIDEGDTVVWDFSGAAAIHTTTGSDWDSGNISEGTFSFTFENAGAFSYVCSIHPSPMKGRIDVVAAQEDPKDTPETEPTQAVSPGPDVTTPPVVGTGPQSGATQLWWIGAVLAGLGLVLVSFARLAASAASAKR